MAKRIEENIEELMEKHQRLTPVAEDISKKLNGIFEEYELDSEDVVMVLGRVCASYIYHMQKLLDMHGNDAPQIVKRGFLNILTSYLHGYDMTDAEENVNRAMKDVVN